MLGTRRREKDSSPQIIQCPGQEILKWWGNDSLHWERHKLQEEQSRTPTYSGRVTEDKEGSKGLSEVALKLWGKVNQIKGELGFYEIREAESETAGKMKTAGAMGLGEGMVPEIMRPAQLMET